MVAAVSYVGVGMFHKFVLNWIIGPLWLVAVVVIGPAVRERWRHRRSEP